MNSKTKVLLNQILDINNLNKNYEVEIIDGLKNPDLLIKPFAEATECLVGFGVWDLGFCPDDFKVDSKGNFVPDDYLDTMMKYGDKVVFSGTDENIAKFKQVTEKFPFAEGKFQPRWVDQNELEISTNMEFYDDITIIFYPIEPKKKVGNIYLANAYVIRNRYLAQTLRSIGLYIWENANTIS